MSQRTKDSADTTVVLVEIIGNRFSPVHFYTNLNVWILTKNMAISFNLFCQWLHWKTFKLVKWLQGNVIDLFFSVIFGFTTAFGKNVDHEESLDNYESSAQVVNVRQVVWRSK